MPAGMYGSREILPLVVWRVDALQFCETNNNNNNSTSGTSCVCPSFLPWPRALCYVKVEAEADNVCAAAPRCLRTATT